MITLMVTVTVNIFSKFALLFQKLMDELDNLFFYELAIRSLD